MLYQILEKTPFSAHYYPSEPFRPVAEFQLQEAEYNLKLNKTHYYEHAVKVGDRFGYPREIAERIAEYWRKRWPFAEYQLSEVESTPNTGSHTDGAKSSGKDGPVYLQNIGGGQFVEIKRPAGKA